jgi:hypothetical protein
MIRGVGPYSTLITPITGSLFHAEFQGWHPRSEIPWRDVERQW